MAIVIATGEKCTIISALENRNNEVMYAVRMCKDEAVDYLVYRPGQLSVDPKTYAKECSVPVDALPCGVDTFSKLNDFGYRWNGMIPLDKDYAYDLLREGMCVYKLYHDGSEIEMDLNSDTEDDPNGSFYGVTVEDWLVHCGRLVDGEAHIYDDDKIKPIPVTDATRAPFKVRAITAETGEEIEGYLVACEGKINKGTAYVCPEVNSIAAQDMNSSPIPCVIGPFIRVIFDTVAPAITGPQVPIGADLAELEAYRKTGLTPKDIQEAVDLFKGTDRSVPEEIKGWVNRATFHTRKCVELEEKIRLLKVQLAGFQVEAMHRMQDTLLKRLKRERRTHIEYVMHEEDLGIPDDGYDVMSNPFVAKASNIALDEAIISVFEDCNLQYMQCMVLNDYEDDLLQAFFEEVKKGEKYSYGEAEIKDAIFNVVSSLLNKCEG